MNGSKLEDCTPLPPTVPPSSRLPLPTNAAELEYKRHMQLRVRLNRIVMHRHRMKRTGSDLASRLVLTGSLFLALLVILLAGGIGGAYAYYNAQLPILKGVATHSLFQTTHIYDRNGQLLYSLYDHGVNHGRRSYVNYSDISQLLVNATVAAEDHTFWTNSGVDLGGIVRAAYSNLQNHGIVEGGSTITQQLIKVQFFPNEGRTYQVKGKEAVLAAGLTQQYPKWKIMEMYLNSVYYGNLNYGVEAASQDFFGLKPKCFQHTCIPAAAQVDLAQASLLAGLPQSPSYYNPTLNKSVALKRQKEVLTGMVDMKYITVAQAEAAYRETSRMTFHSYSSAQPAIAPHFVQYVIDDVLLPYFGHHLLDGGYNIYTTLDLTLEKRVEQIVYDHLYEPTYDNFLGYSQSLSITHNINNGAAVVMNPQNGEILAMDGSAQYTMNNPTIQGQFNATLAQRQPGSSFKPIVYATAFEMGWYPAMIIPDHHTIFPRRDGAGYYAPQNYDGTFHTGFPMTVRNAIANSFNIPAIDALMYAGIPNVENMAGRLGLSEVEHLPLDQTGPSMALGAVDVSLLHMTGAYATFANGGVRVPPTSVLRITDSQGHVLFNYNADHPQGYHVLQPDIAYLMSSILEDKSARYHEFSPGNPLEMSFPAAAKTGTTDSFRDNWTLGYTPHLAVGVWAGNNDHSIMNQIIGITGAGPIWHDVLDYATQRYHFAHDDFARPTDVHRGTVSATTGLLPNPGEATVSDWFIDGTLPTITGASSYGPSRNRFMPDGTSPDNNCEICRYSWYH